MKRYFVLAVVALGLVFTACDEEENLNSSVWGDEIFVDSRRKGSFNRFNI